MWKWWLLCYILLQFGTEAIGIENQRRTALDTPFNIMLLRIFQNFTFDVFGTDARHLQIAIDAGITQKIIPDDVPFPCDVAGGRSEKVPDSVHKLRPGDIDVIAAIGDSITAGAGIFARNLFQLGVENRGASAFGGGQGTWRQYLTIPNIIKEYNHNLTGFALGDSLTIHEASQLNVAESGAVSQDIPYMTEILVKKFKSNPKIDIKKHWKLISIMFGDNDFCINMCWVQSPWSILESHKADLIEIMRILRDNLPRTFVMLIPPIHLELLVQARENARSSSTCSFMTNFECPCIFGFKYRKFRSEYYNVMKRWQELDMEIANYPEFQRDDFAIVPQPVTMQINVSLASDGYTDMTYFSSDCFHLSQKCNARLANAIWNSLLEPVGAKATKYWTNTFERFLCPTPERPYLVTMQNSR